MVQQALSESPSEHRLCSVLIPFLVSALTFSPKHLSIETADLEAQ